MSRKGEGENSMKRKLSIKSPPSFRIPLKYLALGQTGHSSNGRDSCHEDCTTMRRTRLWYDRLKNDNCRHLRSIVAIFGLCTTNRVTYRTCYLIIKI